MSYIGNTPTQQNFVAGADQFNGNGSTTAFTLSRNVNTVFDIFVAISNVPQDPYSAYSVSGNTLTFTSAPPSGTGNIYVVYRATNVQTFVPTPGVSASFGDVTYTGTLTGSTGVVNIGSGQLYKDTSGNVGIGTSSPNGTLNVKAQAGQGAPLRLEATDAGANPQTVFAGSRTYQIGTGNASSGFAGQLFFYDGTAAATRMLIDSSGNVGIGTSSPANRLHVKGAWTSNEGQFQIDADSGQQFSGMTLQNNGTYKALFYNDNTNLLTFLTTASGSNQPLLFGTNEIERARIDTSGNFILTAAGNINLNIFNTQSLAQSGYQKFPNGMIMQWGRVTMAGTSASVTFPITFPNALWCVAGIPKYGTQVGLAFNNESTSGMTLRTSINTGDYFPYIVIGY